MLLKGLFIVLYYTDIYFNIKVLKFISISCRHPFDVPNYITEREKVSTAIEI